MANEKDLEARFKALEEQNAKLMAALEAKFDAQPQTSGIDAAQLTQILTKVTEAAAGPSQVLAAKLKPENADHLHIGAFEHPKGGIDQPKPPLNRVIFWGRPLTLHELTYAEVIALNALSDTLTRSQQRLARNGKWKATVSNDDAQISITVPVKTIDDRQDLPSFLQIVQELTSGEKALDTADLLNELALLKAQVAGLQTAHA